MATRFRLSLLLIGLLLACTWLWQQNAGAWLPRIYYPSACNQNTPEWFPSIISLARELDYPGFQIAHQTSKGDLVLCSAGWAQTSGLLPKQMTSQRRLRYASLSKILTSVEAIRLVQDNRLTLATPLPSLLGLPADSDEYVDSRIPTITLQQLLSHTAGFDRNITPDPMMAVNPWCPDNLSALMNIHLDHPPGTHYAYSNVGYCLVGAIIARAHDHPLSKVFEERLFTPLQLDFIQLAPNEHLLPDEAEPHPAQEESLYQLLSIDYASAVATGAWTGTAGDFSQLLNAYFGKAHQKLPSHIQRLLTNEQGCDTSIWRHCHGLAFYLQKTSDNQIAYWRDGSLPGVTAIAMLFPDGSNLVFLANSRPYHWIDSNNRLGQALMQLSDPD